MSDFTDKGNSGNEGSSLLGRIMHMLFGGSAHPHAPEHHGGRHDNEHHNGRQQDHEHHAGRQDPELSDTSANNISTELAQAAVKGAAPQVVGLSFMGAGVHEAEFSMKDDGLIIRESSINFSVNHSEPVNQNMPEDHEHKGANFTNLDFHIGNDDVLADPNEIAAGTYLSSHSFINVETQLDHTQAANDLGHNVMLDASDVLNMGNNLVITGHELDCVNFQDEGWTKLDDHNTLPAGMEHREGFDTYVHDSGAIVQIEHIIHTNFDPHGHI